MTSIAGNYSPGGVGWDIGDASLQAARVGPGGALTARAAPFEIQDDLDRLVEAMRSLWRQTGGGPGDLHGVTMTAERSPRFRSQREGVNRILDAVQRAFDPGQVRIFGSGGAFLSIEAARHAPFVVASANWAATAMLVARHHPDAILLDIGSATTSIIPIAGGRVAAAGFTTPDRLKSGELLDAGVLRTPVEALTTDVPYGGGRAFVSAGGLALTGDLWVYLERVHAAHYSGHTPDGRPATREFARERLARVVGGDTELLADDAILAIAEAIADAQLARVGEGLERVRARWPAIGTAVVAGLGDFLAEAAASRAGMHVVRLAERLGLEGARLAPAAAVALLHAERP
jgi:probable H4MPT-linked C1 transfer pathway protein